MAALGKEHHAIDRLAYVSELVSLFGRRMDAVLTFVDDVPDVLRERLIEAFTSVKQEVRKQCETVGVAASGGDMTTYPSGQPMWEYIGVGTYRLIPPGDKHTHALYRSEVV
ncbi:hypothetical protein [Corynebacterium rouxii]|uniref:Uncharacterized protein n=1 Tax=Corynebacterium rouxii TaxID=2719119 RepID=A0ABU3PJP5_9CORY|nr:hypothetical protein [Corynebacterium rouxii]MDT9407880.1 hypothetical protein [Corynebacterium rouxii]MDT9410062.1 hypothetical protein [Corynebacterium rouxii]